MTPTLSPTTRRLIVLFLVLALFSWVFGDVLFRDRNFVYRDAGHFYYPLLQLVRDEWDAGRWPLWNPYENGGMPLLANPTTAVMYPPRVLIFQWFPRWLPMSYGAAYKWYILSHMLLAAGTAYAMARHWRASEFAAGLAALSFAFGAVVMFQYCNVIFLVGAAWVPLGLVATDRMLREGDWRWTAALGLVLTMQTLGGDPEAAYVTGGLAALYLAMLDAPVAIALVVLCGVHGAARFARTWFSDERPGAMTLFADGACFALGMLVLAAVAGWHRRSLRRTNAASTDDRRMIWRRRRCLAIAALVAGGLSAVQLIPSLEFSRLTSRAAGELHIEPYAFWLAPWRLVEFIWPNVTGHQFSLNTRWLDLISVNDRLWEPSLYAGVLPAVLAVLAWRARGVPQWQRWLSLTLVLSVWGAFGPAGGASWYWNQFAAHRAASQSDYRDPQNPPSANSGDAVQDPNEGRLRVDLENPAGGLYWFLVRALPGFGSFRYPAKLLSFAVAALAVLAAVGWDRLFAEGNARWLKVLAAIAAASLFLMLVVGLASRPIGNYLRATALARESEPFGPLQCGNEPGPTMLAACRHFLKTRGTFAVPDAVWCSVVAFGQVAVLLGLVWAAARRVRSSRNADALAAAALAFIAVDLGLANRWLVATAPQSDLDAVPRVAEIIAQAEAAATENETGPPQPFRVHRMSAWSPHRFRTAVSPTQHEDVFRWEKETIQPKYGLLSDGSGDRVTYTINEGTMELFDYWFFFGPFYRATPAGLRAQVADPTHLPDRVVYYPRRGFDLWNAKYFVLPELPDFDDEDRGSLSFLIDTELIASSPPGADDFRVVRNLNVFPRAWIVHRLELRVPIRGMSRLARRPLMEEILYQGDAIWFSPQREANKKNPREMAWVEIEPAELDRVATYNAPRADSSGDSCQIVSYTPDRVELEATTTARGLLVVADALYPGWHATVDDHPQPILRANRLMRGLTLDPGTHRVVFTYKPLSFRIGGTATLASLGVLVLALLVSAARRKLA